MKVNIYRFYIPIYTLSHTLLSYVNDLLDVAQFRAGKFKIVLQEFRFLDLIENIVEVLTPLTNQKKIYIKIEF